MQCPMPKHVAACPVCRPKWVVWREADYNPARPNNPGTASLMDERSIETNPVTGRSNLREWQEELQRSQMDVIADICASGRCVPQPTPMRRRRGRRDQLSLLEEAS